ncbi:leucine--tRNA ligase [Elizabethkingia miricola]|uniref:Leucine--tRNA ligase n=1 Tax=Elizabethkingia miricola TaxID=172045 RepID=A0ABD4DL47_ELIMR|nr:MULTISPECIES: leucine--tRNA ligase [Elizabethkingia]KUY19437.1 leucine--tRNA ligase [Elizabethkingia miricola]MCL1651053.1 leucine--tRNA ligase [Elizabethkingia miricola]OPC71596.1 leucine--tRNA ligase [Elizabethkingia miricola]OPC73342.1 leucine--tRNA ligase [Elizabethkingia miricola]QCO46555.1 leucine--tRNA ligase [Elizabethkingia sp. 2-6]
MYYDHNQIENKWQQYWAENETYKTDAKSTKPKYYVLDMFPYPSGAGLHVGHPLGYIASDIVSRYKRHQGFSVLHPIGYDSFGLPAEQYAIQTGQHPAITTEENINRYEKQLKRIGFSFDWSRQFRTSDASYYKFTQWIFIELFHSWYNNVTDKAEAIDTLIKHLSEEGTEGLNAVQTEKLEFTAAEWNAKSEKEQQEILLNYRLAFRAETTVNWCPGLGTVLANDEVINGKSERGGFPVYQKKMMQWSMRITAYSERLLQGLKTLDWPQPLKDAQEYWIGKSQGAEVNFGLENSDVQIKVFTTRPDTIFGSTFMVLAPESPLVQEIVTAEQKEEVQNYIEQTSLKSERDRMADVKTVSGAFTGVYAINPFTGKKMPVYISDYVLMGYGTGAVMAVPAHDERDHRFAKKFGLEITEVVEGGENVQEEPFIAKDGICINSDFLNGLKYDEAKAKAITEVVSRGLGNATTNYRQRDAIFSRQRYWGEPVPVYYKDDVPYTLPASALPLELPEVEKYLPTEDGDPPLGNAKDYGWDEANQKIVATDLIDNKTIFPLELSTMPGWAGSSWYFLRYMDAHNDSYFADKEMTDYWGQVDLYIGGSEHATGHLLYSRFWNKFLKDRNYIEQEEPFQKLINQGMILGMSAFVFRIDGTNQFVSKSLAKDYATQKIHVDVSLLKGATDELDTEAFKSWRPEFKDAEFILEEGDKYVTEREVEKMSKSKFNVVNPDDICDEYGADCLRLYEMFLGPLEQSKPWNTQGLSGVYGFLKRLWNLYFSANDEFEVTDEEPTKEEYRVLHTLIQKVLFDIENFSFNTSVSSFMIAVNELTKLKTNKRQILEPLAVIISPYAPHITEEIWSLLGKKESIEYAPFPVFNSQYLELDEIEYPVSFNGKMRFKAALSANLTPKEVEEAVLKLDKTIEILNGAIPKKIIVVPKKIVNFVI